MIKASMTRALLSFCISVALGFGAEAAAVGSMSGPTDWSDWEKHRDSVVHPATIIKPQDLTRAKENIQRYPWARSYVDRLRRSADGVLEKLSPEYLEQMIEPTTPGCTGPCPACRAQGRPWHPNGQWRWSSSRPNQLTRSVCKTVFPHEEFPESVVVECTWGRGQKFTFIGGETFKCFGYTQARPSLSGIIRAKKLSHIYHRTAGHAGHNLRADRTAAVCARGQGNLAAPGRSVSRVPCPSWIRIWGVRRDGFSCGGGANQQPS